MNQTYGKISTPLTFILAGIGMLLQLPVDQGAGNFYENVNNEAYFWNLSHIILLFSVATMIPAGLYMASSLQKKGPKVLGNLALILLLPTSIFLGGQYAIDFVAPIAASIGGEAITAYNTIDQTMPAAILFYGLSNLSILMLMLMTIAMVWEGVYSKQNSILLMVIWVCVLIGNLIDPIFQRSMILILGFSFFYVIKSEADVNPS